MTELLIDRLLEQEDFKDVFQPISKEGEVERADVLRQESPFKVIKVPRGRRCHSCGIRIGKGEKCISYRRGQCSINLCPRCLDYFRETIKGEEQFTYAVGDRVNNVHMIEFRGGQLIIKFHTDGIIKELLSGDRYKVEFAKHYNRQDFWGGKPHRSLGSITVNVSARSLSRA
jgi:hypothetical protein